MPPTETITANVHQEDARTTPKDDKGHTFLYPAPSGVGKGLQDDRVTDPKANSHPTSKEFLLSVGCAHPFSPETQPSH